MQRPLVGRLPHIRYDPRIAARMLKVMASVSEPEVIAKILAYLQRTARDQFQCELPLGPQAPPSSARLL